MISMISDYWEMVVILLVISTISGNGFTNNAYTNHTNPPLDS